jgi:hypothetical protein
LFLFLVPFVLLLFICLFSCFFFSNSLGHQQSGFRVRLNGVFLFSSSPDSFVVNSRTLDVLRSKASLQFTWPPLFQALNSAWQSDPDNATAQEPGNASLATNDAVPGTTTNDRFVSQQEGKTYYIGRDWPAEARTTPSRRNDFLMQKAIV